MFFNIRFHRLSSLLLIGSQFICGFSSAYEIKTLRSITDLTYHMQAKTLLVTDLDHTLLEPKTYEGSEPWFQNIMALGSGHEKAVAIDFYCKVQQNIEVRAVEPNLPIEWQKWRQIQDLAIIGLTSRSYCLAAITHEQLSLIGLTFPHNWLVDESMPGMAYDGILFASGRNKGEMIHLFLQSHPEFQDWNIIFVDDSYHHIEHVASMIENKYPSIPHSLFFHYPVSRQRYEEHRHVPSLSLEKLGSKLPL